MSFITLPQQPDHLQLANNSVMFAR